MQKLFLGAISAFIFTAAIAQKEVVSSSQLDKVTVFFQGAQLEHSQSIALKSGKQTVVFEKLTDFLDPNSMQVKAQGNVTILSVGLRKNYEDKRISNAEILDLSAKIKSFEKQEKALRDEHYILELDKTILSQNTNLKGNDSGVKVAELKEAYSFIHARYMEISKRQAEITDQLEKILKEKNKLQQEIDVQRSKPVVNYSEIVVELDVQQAGNAKFHLTYISPNATWSPYYDMRSNGIGSPVQLEAKAFVQQKTGIDWKDIDLVLSTNDPYQNANEKELLQWNLDYNVAPYIQNVSNYVQPQFDYTGQKIRGEVIDASTGESMPFAKVYFSNNPTLSTMTNGEGKFEITVPPGGTWLQAAFVGYQLAQAQVNAPYIKFFLVPNGLRMASVPVPTTHNQALTSGGANYDQSYSSAAPSYNNIDDISVQSLEYVKVKKGRKKLSKTDDMDEREEIYANTVDVEAIQRDLRVEYVIQSKFTIPSDGMDQRVAIANYQLGAQYEYHTAPKIDEAVYLVAQVSGWEKLNLLSGESNIYFDGTFIGKSYVDVGLTKDTLSFSMGKDSKIQVTRTRLAEKSKSKAIGSRQRYEVAWDIKLKNNGGAEIPIIVKDQFPVSINADIKVKNGDYNEAKLNENTGILTWQFTLPKNQSKTLSFNYSVDYQKGYVIYLE